MELTADLPIADFADAAMRGQRVMVLPANVMKFEGNYFRLGLGRRNLPQALEPFERALKEQFG